MMYINICQTFHCRQFQVICATSDLSLVFLVLVSQLSFQLFQLPPGLKVEAGELRVPLSLVLLHRLLQLLPGLHGGPEGLLVVRQTAAY